MRIFFITQLLCKVNQPWMWDFICKEWDNSTNCVRDKDGMVRINAFTKYNQLELIEKEKCLFFEVHQALFFNSGT